MKKLLFIVLLGTLSLPICSQTTSRMAMRKLKADGVTTLLVTHDVEFAAMKAMKEDVSRVIRGFSGK